MATSVGVRKLRQDASELIRRVEAGEEIVVTVSGRASARLVAAAPTKPEQWRTWDEVSDLFVGAADSEWNAVAELVDGTVRDPWKKPE